MITARSMRGRAQINTQCRTSRTSRRPYMALVFSTVHLVIAFNQIPVAKEDIPKTAITAPFGLFEFPFMTFGLRNAAQRFQHFIDNVL